MAVTKMRSGKEFKTKAKNFGANSVNRRNEKNIHFNVGHSFNAVISFRLQPGAKRSDRKKKTFTNQ